MYDTFVSRAVTSGTLACWAAGVRGEITSMSRPPWGRAPGVGGAAGTGAEGGAVGVGDGADDGQAEPVSRAMPGPLGAELPERLEQVLHRVWRDECAGVADRDDSARGGRCRADLCLAAGQVVPDGVVEEVGDQALGQARVSGYRGRGECRAEVDAVAPGTAATAQEHIPRDVGARQAFQPPNPALAAGQGEQRRDQALLLIAELDQFLAGRPQRLHRGPGAGDAALERRPPAGERGPHPVGAVAVEGPLRRDHTPTPPH